MADDEALDGDLELDADQAEGVKGGMLASCPGCGHLHKQGDPKCGPYCTTHGGAGSNFY